jgi:hypothetical protein
MDPFLVVLSFKYKYTYKYSMFYSYIYKKIKLVYWGVESHWVHWALRPLLGVLCQPRVVMMMEKLVE